MIIDTISDILDEAAEHGFAADTIILSPPTYTEFLKEMHAKARYVNIQTHNVSAAPINSLYTRYGLIHVRVGKPPCKTEIELIDHHNNHFYGSWQRLQDEKALYDALEKALET